MMANPLFKAQQRALSDAAWLKRLFARVIGSREHPRGAVLNAYRRARKLARGPVQAHDALGLALVLRQLRRELTNIALEATQEAQARGIESAALQVRAYDPTLALATPVTPASTFAALWLAPLEQQEQELVGLLRLPGEHTTEILGDNQRAGLFTPAPLMIWAARALALTLQTAQRESWMILEAGWYKQAIAAIDERTTDCCLRVAGQIQPLGGLFKLHGTPRFADEMDWSPFHWNCRTSICLYRHEFDDDLTAKLRRDVEKERERREKV